MKWYRGAFLSDTMILLPWKKLCTTRYVVPPTSPPKQKLTTSTTSSHTNRRCARCDKRTITSQVDCAKEHADLCDTTPWSKNQSTPPATFTTMRTASSRGRRDAAAKHGRPPTRENPKTQTCGTSFRECPFRLSSRSPTEFAAHSPQIL